MINFKTKTCYLALFTVFFLSCANNKKNKVYRSGDLTYTQYQVGNSEDTLRTVYDNKGSIEEMYILRNGQQDGCDYFFSPNGNIQKILYYSKGILMNTGAYFDDSCKLKSIAKYYHNLQVQHITFANPNVKEKTCNSVVITNSGTFVTLDADADTITLGETYSARIIVNFPKKGYDCNIYTLDKIQQQNSVKYTLLENGHEAVYKDTPKEVGEHKYEISVVQLKTYSTKEDSTKIEDGVQITFSVKYFVKPKIW